MAEEFQGGVCGGNLWNSSRNLFGLSPCSSNLGSFALLENMVFPTAISDDHFRRSNHDLITDTKTSSHESGRSEEIYSHVLQESEGLNSNMNFCENSYTFIQQQPSNYFPLNSDSYSLLQTLFDTDFQTTNSSSSSLNYHMNSAEFSDSLTKVLPMVKPTLPTQQASNHLQFTNNTPISWNHATFRASFVPSSLNSAKPNLHNFNAKRQNEEVGDLDSKKVSSKSVLKRPRVETPSPLPTFKVRKEKLGDRVTALQQLVSPFGKTDTASVLQEAIEYIKFLHDQVNTLSTPYLKDGSSPLQPAYKIKDEEGRIRDLKSRGLCLVPISSTFPVAAETTTDFWTSTLGGSFR